MPSSSEKASFFWPRLAFFFAVMSANNPTARPCGPALQALNLSKFVWPSQCDMCSFLPLRHSIRVYIFIFFPILAHSGPALLVFVGRLLLVYRRFHMCHTWPRALTRVSPIARLHLLQCGVLASLRGVRESPALFSFSSNSRIFDVPFPISG